MAWHPLGHILCSGSNDHTIKFWTRNRPGDLMRDKYNLNTLPANLAMLDECEYGKRLSITVYSVFHLDYFFCSLDDAAIPGMGPEDKIEFTESLTADTGFIPGLDVDPNSTIATVDSKDPKKVPYSKPIPRNFQAHWNDTGKMDDDESPQSRDNDNRDFSRAPPADHQPMPPVPQTPPQQVQTVCGILVYDKFIPVVPSSKLAQIVNEGINALNKYISAGELEEVRDLIPKEESKSPPAKKSRFERIVDHKPVIIYNDTPESRLYQNMEISPNSNNTNIPSLMNMKLSNPENNQTIKVERDWNGGRFNENDRNNTNSNNNNNNSNNNNNNNNHNARSNGRSSRFSDGGSSAGGDARRRRRRN